MDPKRKSLFDPPLSAPVKRTKLQSAAKTPDNNGHQPQMTCRVGGDTSKEASDEEPVEPEKQSRLRLLGDLVRDIVVSGDLLENHPGPDITNAITELDRAFRHADTATTDSSSEEGPVRLTRTPGPRDDSFLPALPAILDGTLEKAVFTHPGLSKDIKTTYDRLEILGDAYIELIATKLIWTKFQELSSGRISQIRELLVKNETLSEFATLYGLDSKASIPQDYLSHPKRWTKTKGDIFESYVAAVILSRPADGYDIVERWLTQLWLPKIRETALQQYPLNAKETLAKKIMGKGVKLRYIDERPPLQLKGGMQTFFIGVYLTGWGWEHKHLGSGYGSSKAIAGDAAARQALLDESLINEISRIKRMHDVGEI